MSIRPISKELQKKAVEELNEVPSRIQEDIKQIRKWIVQEAHLAHIKIEDQLILNFLRGCKFSLQRTKEKVDMFYTMKSLLPEFYRDRDPFRPEIQEVLNSGPCLPLSKTIGADGPRIILLRCKHGELKHDTILNTGKAILMFIDILLREDDNFVISGQQGFIDLKDATVNHLRFLDVGVIKKAAVCLERAYPTRPQGFHCLNFPDYIEKMLHLAKLVLSEKLRNRILIYTEQNAADMYKTIPRSILPKEYGGDGESIEQLTAYWKKKVEDNREWLLADEKNRSDETKRIGTSKTSAELFGVEGSFRKLEVD